jgi:hypothetical protein
MGQTTLAATTSVLQPTTSFLPLTWGTTYSISAVSTTNTTDFLITFTGNHNFKVGQYIGIAGTVMTSGDNPNGGRYVKTVPAANQVTLYNKGTPVNPVWASGGVAYGAYAFNAMDSADTYYGFAKYVNNKYFVADTYGNLFYSNDGITWTWTVPTRVGVTTNNGQQMWLTDIDYDGTVYAVCDLYGNISTSSDLATWTSVLTGSGTRLQAIKWCGGSYNAWVAGGGSGNTYALYTAAVGAGTWTSRTVASINGNFKSFDFDGNTTVVGCFGNWDNTNNYGGWAYSTTAATWTGTSVGSTVGYVYYNPNNSLWHFGSWLYYGSSWVRTTANLGTASNTNQPTDWTKYGSSPDYSYSARTTNIANAYFNIPNGRKPILDKVNNVWYFPTTTNNFFVDNKYSALPVNTTDFTNGNATGFYYTKLATNSYSIADSVTPYWYPTIGNNQGYLQLNGFLMWIWSGTKWVVLDFYGASTSTAQKVINIQ